MIITLNVCTNKVAYCIYASESITRFYGLFSGLGEDDQHKFWAAKQSRTPLVFELEGEEDALLLEEIAGYVIDLT